jgi:hypothetical protein
MKLRPSWLTPWLLFLTYTLIRAVSFLFPPDTALHPASSLNSIITAGIVLITCALLVKKNSIGWYIVAGELIIGGAGNFFALHGVSLRTVLLGTALSIFTLQNWSTFREMYTKNKVTVWCLSLLYLVVGLGALRGILAGHGIGPVFADTIPYVFFLYFFPLQKILGSERGEDFKKFVWNCLIATSVGNALFTGMTFGLFSTGYSTLQDTYYHWFRDVAGGKITELPFHFYRIVLNEQLVLVPLLLFFITELLESTKAKKIVVLLSFFLLSILAINLTRSFLLALLVGFLMLFRPRYWKRWLATTTLTVGVFVSIFVGIHTLASRGHSLGLEIFGLRLQSIVTPSLEPSSLSRLLLLPKIIDTIKTHPILGEGLADSVTVYSPVVQHEITTTQFDWGYLEIWSELGLIGLVAWGILLGYIGIQIKADSFEPAWQFASLGALLVITITAPALFHVLGITWITFVAVKLMSPPGDASQKSSF